MDIAGFLVASDGQSPKALRCQNVKLSLLVDLFFAPEMTVCPDI